MKVGVTPLAGLMIIDLEKKIDERGFFARTWDPEVAKTSRLVASFTYSCVSRNTKKHTLRGMHYQKEPYGETKLVRVTKGEIFDVAIDLRRDSPTFMKWHSVILSESNHRAFYIPAGFAHGFITLTSDTEVLYDIVGVFNADAATGVRFNDSAFNITWPASPVVISDRDQAYPDFL